MRPVLKECNRLFSTVTSDGGIIGAVRARPRFSEWRACHDGVHRMNEPESALGEVFNPNVSFLEPTLKRAAIVWWWFYWRALLLGCLLGGLVGIVEGVIGRTVGISFATKLPLLVISGFVVSSAVQIFVVQSLLLKTFAEFKIRLLPTKTEPSN